MECAQVGLLPDGDGAALVPYKVKGVPTAKLIKGYKGMLDLIRMAIPGVSINVNVATTEDYFKYVEGTQRELTHEPSMTTKNLPSEKNIIAAYMVTYMPGNPVAEIEVMSRAQLDHIRSRYTQEESKMWIQEFAEACKKTVVRRGAKKFPIRSGLLKRGFTPPIDSDPIGDYIAQDPIDVTAQEVEPQQQAQPQRQTQPTRGRPRQPAPAPAQQQLEPEQDGPLESPRDAGF